MHGKMQNLKEENRERDWSGQKTVGQVVDAIRITWAVEDENSEFYTTQWVFLKQHQEVSVILGIFSSMTFTGR